MGVDEGQPGSEDWGPTHRGQGPPDPGKGLFTYTSSHLPQPGDSPPLGPVPAQAPQMGHQHSPSG